MANYARMYRFGMTPWERYAEKARSSIAGHLDHATTDRAPGRVLDLGCGRGLYGSELARRGWNVVGVDAVPAAIQAASANASERERYLVGDVTSLPNGLGSFDLFLDVGCLQGLTPNQQVAYGEQVTACASPGATMLSLQFGQSRYRRLCGGISEAEVVRALPAWELVASEPAETRGLGWPMSRTNPAWYRLKRL